MMEKKPYEMFGENINQANNGSMVENLEEAKKLGKEMKKMKTETELHEEGMIQDPQQLKLPTSSIDMD